MCYIYVYTHIYTVYYLIHYFSVFELILLSNNNNIIDYKNKYDSYLVILIHCLCGCSLLYAYIILILIYV